MGVSSPPGGAPGAIELRERPPASIDPDTWDGFVARCGGSFLGSWRVVRVNRLRSRVRVFDLHRRSSPGQDEKIGQCAVAVGRGRVRFLDRLHVLPACRDAWESAWRALLDRLGPGIFEYGSLWNHDDGHPADVPGATFQVDRVDFGAWPDFAAYRRSVSENIRRDHRKAAATSAQVVTRYGLDALRDVPALTRLRRHTLRRHQERFSELGDYARHTLKLACLGPTGFIATVREGSRCRAAFLGARFGGRIYHLAGGTDTTGPGFGSFLFLTLIEQWFAEDPRGGLYLGHYPEAWDPQTYIRGNLLYRRKLRATAVPGVRFSVSVGAGRARRTDDQPGATARSALR